MNENKEKLLSDYHETTRKKLRDKIAKEFPEYKPSSNVKKLILFNYILKCNGLPELTDNDIKESEEQRKKLKVSKTGITVKNRASSTINGMVISYSNYYHPEVTNNDIKIKEQFFKLIDPEMDPNKCFWCKEGKYEEKEHAHPCCNYSYTNALNIVPSCKSCNSK